MKIANSDLEDAVRYSKPLLYKWKDYEFHNMVELLIEQQKRFDFKFVVALCIYNEEQFLSDALNTCLQFVDLDGIHILDGAWEHGGDHPKSTDKTHTIIDDFKNTHPDIKVTVEYPHEDVWRTEGVKRNFQLQSIEHEYGSAYVFILDGDEIIQTNSGQTRHWMKHELNAHMQMIGMVAGYARGSKSVLNTPRLIPTKYGHHYHTECPMLIHNKNCEIIVDYEWNFTERNYDYLFNFDNFRIINNLNIRTRERTIEKQAYVDSLPETWGECKWTT